MSDNKDKKGTEYNDQVRFLDERGMEIVRVNYAGGSPYIVPGGERTVSK